GPGAPRGEQDQDRQGAHEQQARTAASDIGRGYGHPSGGGGTMILRRQGSRSFPPELTLRSLSAGAVVAHRSPCPTSSAVSLSLGCHPIHRRMRDVIHRRVVLHLGCDAAARKSVHTDRNGVKANGHRFRRERGCKYTVRGKQVRVFPWCAVA